MKPKPGKPEKLKVPKFPKPTGTLKKVYANPALVEDAVNEIIDDAIEAGKRAADLLHIAGVTTKPSFVAMVTPPSGPNAGATRFVFHSKQAYAMPTYELSKAVLACRDRFKYNPGAAGILPLSFLGIRVGWVIVISQDDTDKANNFIAQAIHDRMKLPF